MSRQLSLSMKHFLSAVLLICVYNFHNLAQTVGDDGLVRIGGSLQTGNIHYYVKLNQLISAPQWDSARQPFPVNIARELAHAKSETQKAERPSENFKMGAIIEIGRLFWDERNTNVYEAPDLTNAWAMQFQIHSITNHKWFNFISLMDGSYASAFDLDDLRSPEATNAFRTYVSRFSPIVLDGFFDNEVNHVLDDPNFSCPKIHWDAESGASYPLDLQIEAMRARDIAAKRHSLSKESLLLVHISLEHYIPIKAVQFQHLNTLEAVNHWLTVFQYKTGTGEHCHYYCVYELLDGRIIEQE